MTESTFPADTIPQADGSPLTTGHVNPDWKNDFHGLLYLGELNATFEWLGHKISIRTLRTDEELIVGQIVEEWQNTVAAGKAYATAVCGIAVEAVDGQPMPSPLGENGSKIQWARERFNYAQRWFPYTIDMIYSKYLELEKRAIDALDELGKASGATAPGPNTSSALPAAGDSSPGPASP